MAAELGAATAPEIVLIGKLGMHRQISGTTVNPIASAFAVDVYIATPVPPSIEVRLRKPSGETIPLEQGPLDRFSHFEYFFNEAELATAYPQGTYTIVVTEGGADTTTAFSFSSNVAAPSRITNYDALQTATVNPLVTWLAIPA